MNLKYSLGVAALLGALVGCNPSSDSIDPQPNVKGVGARQGSDGKVCHWAGEREKYGYKLKARARRIRFDPELNGLYVCIVTINGVEHKYYYVTEREGHL